MSTQLKTVLIAGATGFLGAKITNAFLAKKEFEVLVLARKPSEKTDEFKSKGAKIVEGDLSDVESLKKVRTILFNFMVFIDDFPGDNRCGCSCVSRWQRSSWIAT